MAGDGVVFVVVGFVGVVGLGGHLVSPATADEGAADACVGETGEVFV